MFPDRLADNPLRRENAFFSQRRARRCVIVVNVRGVRSYYQPVIAQTRSREHLGGMSSFVRRWLNLLCFLCYLVAQRRVFADENRPYQFAFNVIDFQHRYEKKDADGLITGEYGFITADGVYHETAYATDKNGDFIITRMRTRKITSLKDAQEIFKDRPEAAKKLVEAVAKACSGCKLSPIKQEDDRTIPPKQMTKILSETAKRVNISTKSISEEKGKMRKDNGVSKTKQLTEDTARNMVRIAKKLDDGPGRVVASDRAPEKMANDLYYRFNYTITTHGHHEDGYRNGKKDGSYRSRSENGVDTHVKYLSNEFGHQPNITFFPRENADDEEPALKGYSFRWYRS